MIPFSRAEWWGLPLWTPLATGPDMVKLSPTEYVYFLFWCNLRFFSLWTIESSHDEWIYCSVFECVTQFYGSVCFSPWLADIFTIILKRNYKIRLDILQQVYLTTINIYKFWNEIPCNFQPVLSIITHSVVITHSFLLLCHKLVRYLYSAC